MAVDLKHVMDDNEIVNYWKTRTDNIDKIKPVYSPEALERKEYVEKMRRMKKLRDRAAMLRSLPASSAKTQAIAYNSGQLLGLQRDVRIARIRQLEQWRNAGIMSDLDYYKEGENVR